MSTPPCARLALLAGRILLHVHGAIQAQRAQCWAQCCDNTRWLLQQCANDLQSRSFQSMPGSPAHQTTRTGSDGSLALRLTHARIARAQGHTQQPAKLSVFFSSQQCCTCAMFLECSSRSLCCGCPLFTGVGHDRLANSLGLCPAPDENGTVTGFNGQVTALH